VVAMRRRKATDTLGRMAVEMAVESRRGVVAFKPRRSNSAGFRSEAHRPSRLGEDRTTRAGSAVHMTEFLVFRNVLWSVDGCAFTAAHDGALVNDLRTDARYPRPTEEGRVVRRVLETNMV